MKQIYFIILLISGCVNGYAQDLKFGWARNEGGYGNELGGESITIDLNGYIYVAGAIDTTAFFIDEPGIQNWSTIRANDIFIQKYDSEGTKLWETQIGSEYNTTEFAKSIVTDNNNDVYVTGNYNSSAVDFDPGPGIFKLDGIGTFFLKLDQNGNFIWAKEIEGNGNSITHSINIDHNNDIYVSGNFRGTLDFDLGQNELNLTSIDESYADLDSFILKLNSDGELIWVKTIENDSNIRKETISTLDDLGNIYIAGTFRGQIDFDPNDGVFNLTSSASSDSGFIVKLDKNGNFVWAKDIIGGNPWISSITVDDFGNLYSTGHFSGTTDFNPNNGSAILTSTNGSVYGDSLNSFILKLDINGNFKFVKQIEGDWVESSVIVTDFLGNIYTSGSIDGNADLDPNEGVYNVTPDIQYGSGIFFQKLSANGNFLWGAQISNSSLNHLTRSMIMDDSSESLYVTGRFMGGKMDFDPSAEVNNLYTKGGRYNYDLFVLKLENNVLTVNDFHLADNFEIYPNPNNGNFTIDFKTFLNKAKISVLDELGRVVHQSDYQNINRIYINFNNYSKGFYFVEIKTSIGKQSIPIIKK
ncbi:hypothetical protein GCM10009430_37580 [Aquimarina litoralis]|uniref:Secretion system C-terminal sorting domain-containing protein n=1 Tax=Aquimarina litoralis TaxID=584605 RepID=A0ABP3UF49_9FLAO